MSPKTKIVKINGHIDTNAHDKILEVFQETKKTGSKNIILDLSNVHYVTSSGFAVIINEWQNLKEQGGELVIVQPPQNIELIFTVLKFKDQMKILNSMESAYEYLNLTSKIEEALLIAESMDIDNNHPNNDTEADESTDSE